MVRHIDVTPSHHGQDGLESVTEKGAGAPDASKASKDPSGTSQVSSGYLLGEPSTQPMRAMDTKDAKQKGVAPLVRRENSLDAAAAAASGIQAKGQGTWPYLGRITRARARAL